MKLEKDNSKKKHLEKMYEDGVINIDNFYNFENTELLIELIDNHNQKELDKIINKIKQEVMDKLIYYLSFLRGENLDVDSLYCSLQCNDKIDKNDELESYIIAN